MRYTAQMQFIRNKGKWFFCSETVNAWVPLPAPLPKKDTN